MIPELLMLAVGLAVGGVAVWVVLKGKIQHAADAAKAAAHSEIAVLTERLQGKESQVQTLSASAEKGNRKIEELQGALHSETEKRAAAETRNNRIAELESELAQEAEVNKSLQGELTSLKEEQAELKAILEKERIANKEKLALLNEAQAKLSDAFRALSSDALKSNNQSFLELAKTTLEKFQEGAKMDLSSRQKAIDDLVKPLKESLEKVDGKMAAIEKERTSAYAGLTEQVKSLATSQNQLQTETANLVKALRAPQVRGRWGEIQLKRVVEMAGMIEYCDFTQQESVNTEDGRLRPDLVVRLPGGKNVVLDSKCPLQGYLDALAEPNEAAKLAHLKKHARQVRDHISKLSTKAYWEQFKSAPEFAVLFLPGETFFSAALEQDPELIECGVEHRVILATPTTLIALLRAVAYGWRQEQIAQNTQQVNDLAREIYDRLRILFDHLSGVGSGLTAATKAYNDAVNSLESRLLVSARKLKEMKAATDKEIEILEPVITTARALPENDLIQLPGASPGQSVFSPSESISPKLAESTVREGTGSN